MIRISIFFFLFFFVNFIRTQGSVSVSVNEGPTEIANAFLSEANQDKYPASQVNDQ